MLATCLSTLIRFKSLLFIVLSRNSYFLLSEPAASPAGKIRFPWQENDFEPKYITIRGKGELLAKLRREVKKADSYCLNQLLPLQGK